MRSIGRLAVGELNVAPTLSMDNGHLLMDIAKTIISTYLAPGDQVQSITMIQ
jgi:hypothetical protein